MSAFYAVFEIQANGSTIMPVEPVAFLDSGDALSKYFTILTAACRSDLDYHRAFVIRKHQKNTFSQLLS